MDVPLEKRVCRLSYGGHFFPTPHEGPHIRPHHGLTIEELINTVFMPKIVRHESPYFGPDRAIAKSLRVLAYGVYSSIGASRLYSVKGAQRCFQR